MAIAAAGTAQGSRLDARQLADMRDAWAIAMPDIPYHVAERALAVAMRTSVYMPAIADIVRAATEMRDGPVRTGADAWGDVQRAIGRYGSRRTPGIDFKFDDLLVAHLVSNAFPWVPLCLSEDVTADRARFIDAYNAAARQGRREAEAPALVEAREVRILVENTARAMTGRTPLALVTDDDDEPPPWKD